MNWNPIESAPIGVRIKLRFRHEIGEYEMPEPCMRLWESFYRLPMDWRPPMKLQPTEWAECA